MAMKPALLVDVACLCCSPGGCGILIVGVAPGIQLGYSCHGIEVVM